MNHGDPCPPAPRPDEPAEPSPWTKTWSDAVPSTPLERTAAPSEPPTRADTTPDVDSSWTQVSWSGSVAPAHAPSEEPHAEKPADPPYGLSLSESSEATNDPQDDLADLHLPRRPHHARGFPQPIPGSALTTLIVAVLSALLVIVSLVWPP